MNRQARRATTRATRREATLIRHGLPIAYDRGQPVFAAYFTRSTPKGRRYR